jgi:hypothetical protein
MKKRRKAISEFTNEEEERKFWESHDFSDYFDWNHAQPLVIPNLKPTTKTILSQLPQHFQDSIKSAANARDVPSNR